MINFQKVGAALFSKKILLQIYFTIFIILNIVDFIGYLQGDFDFFKKLLSWSLIGYVFYKASPTKIFTGTRNKLVDITLIIAFSLMTIIKSLMHYVNLDTVKQTQFLIFNQIIQYFQTIQNVPEFLQLLFSIGVIITIILSIYILKKTPATKESLVGSFNLTGYLKFIGGEYLILIISMIFFSLIVFNFFMEWFALAVDSLILVLGLTFYLLKYLHKHTNIKTSKLGIISNTGNQFYQNLISYFSNKKTFLIGVSFLLTIHLLVDIGVYLVPYTFGNANTLYSQTINTPIFNIINFENSQFFADLQISNSYLTNLTIILAHATTILTFFLLMVGPFYYFYKFIQKIKTHSHPIFKHIFLTGSILYLVIYLLPSFSLPITLDMPNLNSGIAGVEFHTSQLILKQTTTLMLEVITFLVTFVLIHIGGYYLLKNTKSSFIKYKLMPIISIIFFTIYISIFFFSVITHETQNIQSNYFETSPTQNEGKYQEIITKLENKQLIKYSQTTVNSTYFQISITPLREKITENNYNDYLLLSLNGIDIQTKYSIENIDNIFFENSSDYEKSKFAKSNTNLIISLGKNHKLFSNKMSINNLIEIINPIIQTKENTNIRFFEIFRIIFTAIFYIFGSIAFVRYFIKKKIFD